MSRLDQHVATVRSREGTSFALTGVAWGAIGVASASVAAILLEKFLLWKPDAASYYWLAGKPMIVLGAATVAAAIGGLVWGMTRRPSHLEAAVRIDERLGTKEKFSTALYLQNQPSLAGDPFARAAVMDALATADKANLTGLFPVRFPRALGIALLLAGLAFGLSYMRTFDLFGREAKAQIAKVEAAKQEEAQKKIEQVLSQIAMAPVDIQNQDEIVLAKQKLQDLQHQTMKDADAAQRTAAKAQESLKDAQAFKEKIKNAQNFAKAQANQKVLASLEDQDDKTPVAEAMKDIKAGDFDKAIDKLSDMAKDFDKLDAEEQKKAADQMQAMAQQMQQAINNNQQMQQLQQQLQQQGINQQQLQQLQQAMQQAAQGNQAAAQGNQAAAQQVQQQVQQMLKQAGANQQQIQQAQQLAQQMQGIQNSSALMQQLQQAAQQMGQAMQQQAAQQGQQANQGGQQGAPQQGQQGQQQAGQQQGQQGQQQGQQQGGQQQGGQQQGGQQQGGQQQGGQQAGGQQGQQGGQQQGGQQGGGQQQGGRQQGNGVQQGAQQMQEALDAIKKDMQQQQAAQRAGQQGGGQQGGGQQGGGQQGGQQGNQGGQRGQNGGQGPWQPGDPAGRQGAGQGGPGQGAGGQAGVEEAPFDFKEEISKSQDNEKGQILAQTLVKADAEKGESTAELREVVRSNLQEATDEVDNQRISRQAQKAVRDYFNGITGEEIVPASKDQPKKEETKK